MTAQLAPRPERHSSTPSTSTPRTQLRQVQPKKRRMATVPFVGVVAFVLALGMVGLLVLTTALQDQTFSVQSKQRQAAELADQLASLKSQVADARSVQSLAAAAQKLGMRPNPYGTQLVVPEGKVIGKAVAVTGGEVPSLRYLTPEQAKAQLDALAKAEAARKAKQKAEAQERKQAAKEKAAKEKAAKEQAARDKAKKGSRP